MGVQEEEIKSRQGLNVKSRLGGGNLKWFLTLITYLASWQR